MIRSRRSASALVIALATLLVAAGCGGDTNESSEPAETTESSEASDISETGDPGSKATTEAPTDRDPSTWSLRQKLAQMLFTGTNAPEDSATDPETIQQLIDAGAGGVFAGRKELSLIHI